MEGYEALLGSLALMMGTSWASGINLYAAILILGVGGLTGNVDLPPDLEVLTDPVVIFSAAFMYCVEFFADKMPGVDTAWDSIHTFIRIPAGAILASASVGEVSLAWEIAAAMLGGGIASCSHAAKAGTRVLINTSPEPFSNWSASILEDVAVILGLWTMFNHPLVFLTLVIIFVALIVFLFPKIWRLIYRVFLGVGRFLGVVDKGETENQRNKSNETDAKDEHLNNNYKRYKKVDSLERLKTLKESGVLTEEEFDLLKENIIRNNAF